MGFTLTKADETLLKKVRIEMTPPDPVNGWFDDLAGKPIYANVVETKTIGGFKSPFSNNIIGGVKESTTVKRNFGKPSVVPLQFPPRVKTKSKSGIWKEKYKKLYEPLVVWMGADATMISLELTYVVMGGKTWNVPTIAKCVHTVMGYFYRGFQNDQGAPLVRIRLYEIAPMSEKMSTWRMKNANVTYSDELVIDGGKTYPQITTITMELAMFTQMKGQQRTFQKVAFAPEFPKKEWY